MSEWPVVVIAGPTASGKTTLAIKLALQFNGEIVGADARQVYRDLDIGTGKATAAEMQGVPHHLINVATPDETFTVTQYRDLATAAIADVHGRSALPILVGGTGFYIRAVVDGLLPPAVPAQPEMRRALERQWEDDRPALLHELAARDPVTAARIDQRNPRRVIRALEVMRVTGRPLSEQSRREPPPYTTLFLALGADRPTLRALADRRIAAMLDGGFVDEVRGLLSAGYDFTLPAFSAVGYREVAHFLAGAFSLAEAQRRMRQATHAYQRRQFTWLRGEPRYHWLDATAPDLAGRSGLLVQAWLANKSSGA